MRATRERKLERGECYSCPEPAEPGKLRCAQCLRKQADARKEYQGERARARAIGRMKL